VHACGLVHRDLKPSNVLLATDGPRVIDFGIASALEMTGLTTTGSVLGSPPYMSPEQAMGAATGPASDVFALGSTLAFAAAGAPPFGDDDAHALLFRVVHMPPALDSVPDRLRGVVAACLAKDPAARPTLPQLLRACQDGAAAGGNSAASFWPRQMTAVIAGYQASSTSAAPPSGTVPSGGQSSPAGQSRPEGQRVPHPPTVAAAPAAPTRPSPLGRAGTTVASAVGRRPVLSGLGGLLIAGGLAAAGWELAGSGRSPAAAGTTTGTTTGRVQDKRVAWVHQAEGPVRAGGALSGDGGTLYIGSDTGTVYALDAASGRQTRTFQAGGAVSGVMVASGTLLVGSADGKVRAFDVADPGFNWTSPAAGGAIAGAPTGGRGEVLYVGSQDGYVYALNIETGQRNWRTKTGGPVVAGQPDGTGVLYAASQDGTLYVLDASSGKVVGRYAAGGAINSAPLVIPGGVYFGTSKGTLYDMFHDGFTNTTGEQWKFAAGGAIAGTPATADDTFFTATTSGTVYAVENGGTQLWSVQVGGPVRAGLAVESGVLYLGCDDGYLYAIDISSNTVSWKYPTGSPIRSRILVNNGHVYFGNLNHQVYALRA
jgi:outer membrane protein assembly factor BamB